MGHVLMSVCFIDDIICLMIWYGYGDAWYFVYIQFFVFLFLCSSRKAFFLSCLFFFLLPDTHIFSFFIKFRHFLALNDFGDKSLEKYKKYCYTYLKVFSIFFNEKSSFFLFCLDFHSLLDYLEIHQQTNHINFKITFTWSFLKAFLLFC